MSGHVEIKGNKYMPGRQCFLKDLKVGDHFRTKASGGVMHTIISFDETTYKIKREGEIKVVPFPSMMPVIPMKTF